MPWAVDGVVNVHSEGNKTGPDDRGSADERAIARDDPRQAHDRERERGVEQPLPQRRKDCLSPGPTHALRSRRDQGHIGHFVLNVCAGRIVDPMVRSVVQVVSQMDQRPASASVHQLTVNQPLDNGARKQH
jgi:hypothetical protein